MIIQPRGSSRSKWVITFSIVSITDDIGQCLDIDNPESNRKLTRYMGARELDNAPLDSQFRRGRYMITLFP